MAVLHFFLVNSTLTYILFSLVSCLIFNRAVNWEQVLILILGFFLSSSFLLLQDKYYFLFFYSRQIVSCSCSQDKNFPVIDLGQIFPALVVVSRKNIFLSLFLEILFLPFSRNYLIKHFSLFLNFNIFILKLSKYYIQIYA